MIGAPVGLAFRDLFAGTDLQPTAARDLTRCNRAASFGILLRCGPETVTSLSTNRIARGSTHHTNP